MLAIHFLAFSLPCPNTSELRVAVAFADVMSSLEQFSIFKNGNSQGRQRIRNKPQTLHSRASIIPHRTFMHDMFHILGFATLLLRTFSFGNCNIRFGNIATVLLLSYIHFRTEVLLLFSSIVQKIASQFPESPSFAHTTCSLNPRHDYATSRCRHSVFVLQQQVPGYRL